MLSIHFSKETILYVDFVLCILLKWVSTEVTRVHNNMVQVPLYFSICMLPQPQVYLLNDRYLYYLKTSEHVSKKLKIDLSDPRKRYTIIRK